MLFHPLFLLKNQPAEALVDLINKLTVLPMRKAELLVLVNPERLQNRHDRKCTVAILDVSAVANPGTPESLAVMIVQHTGDQCHSKMNDVDPSGVIASRLRHYIGLGEMDNILAASFVPLSDFDYNKLLSDHLMMDATFSQRRDELEPKIMGAFVMSQKPEEVKEEPTAVVKQEQVIVVQDVIQILANESEFDKTLVELAKEVADNAKKILVTRHNDADYAFALTKYDNVFGIYRRWSAPEPHYQKLTQDEMKEFFKPSMSIKSNQDIDDLLGNWLPDAVSDDQIGPLGWGVEYDDAAGCLMQVAFLDYPTKNKDGTTREVNLRVVICPRVIGYSPLKFSTRIFRRLEHTEKYSSIDLGDNRDGLVWIDHGEVHPLLMMEMNRTMLLHFYADVKRLFTYNHAGHPRTLKDEGSLERTLARLLDSVDDSVLFRQTGYVTEFGQLATVFSQIDEEGGRTTGEIEFVIGQKAYNRKDHSDPVQINFISVLKAPPPKVKSTDFVFSGSTAVGMMDEQLKFKAYPNLAWLKLIRGLKPYDELIQLTRNEQSYVVTKTDDGIQSIAATRGDDYLDAGFEILPLNAGSLSDFVEKFQQSTDLYSGIERIRSVAEFYEKIAFSHRGLVARIKELLHLQDKQGKTGDGMLEVQVSYRAPTAINPFIHRVVTVAGIVPAKIHFVHQLAMHKLGLAATGLDSPDKVVITFHSCHVLIDEDNVDSYSIGGLPAEQVYSVFDRRESPIITKKEIIAKACLGEYGHLKQALDVCSASVEIAEYFEEKLKGFLDHHEFQTKYYQTESHHEVTVFESTFGQGSLALVYAPLTNKDTSGKPVIDNVKIIKQGKMNIVKSPKVEVASFMKVSEASARNSESDAVLADIISSYPYSIQYLAAIDYCPTPNQTFRLLVLLKDMDGDEGDAASLFVASIRRDCEGFPELSPEELISFFKTIESEVYTTPFKMLDNTRVHGFKKQLANHRQGQLICGVLDLELSGNKHWSGTGNRDEIALEYEIGGLNALEGILSFKLGNNVEEQNYVRGKMGFAIRFRNEENVPEFSLEMNSVKLQRPSTGGQFKLLIKDWPYHESYNHIKPEGLYGTRAIRSAQRTEAVDEQIQRFVNAVGSGTLFSAQSTEGENRVRQVTFTNEPGSYLTIKYEPMGIFGSPTISEVIFMINGADREDAWIIAGPGRLGDAKVVAQRYLDGSVYRAEIDGDTVTKIIRQTGEVDAVESTLDIYQSVVPKVDALVKAIKGEFSHNPKVMDQVGRLVAFPEVVAGRLESLRDVAETSAARGFVANVELSHSHVVVTYEVLVGVVHTTLALYFGVKPVIHADAIETLDLVLLATMSHNEGTVVPMTPLGREPKLFELEYLEGKHGNAGMASQRAKRAFIEELLSGTLGSFEQPTNYVMLKLALEQIFRNQKDDETLGLTWLCDRAGQWSLRVNAFTGDPGASLTIMFERVEPEKMFANNHKIVSIHQVPDLFGSEETEKTQPEEGPIISKKRPEPKFDHSIFFETTDRNLFIGTASNIAKSINLCSQDRLRLSYFLEFLDTLKYSEIIIYRIEKDIDILSAAERPVTTRQSGTPGMLMVTAYAEDNRQIYGHYEAYPQPD